jgi:hypothetical protein
VFSFASSSLNVVANVFSGSGSPHSTLLGSENLMCKISAFESRYASITFLGKTIPHALSMPSICDPWQID